jgi:hypothetical protein
MVLPGLAWVIIVLHCPSIPLLCNEGLGEVETWSGIMRVPLCNFLPIARLYSTLILPLQRGGDLLNTISEKTWGTNTPTKNPEVLL